VRILACLAVLSLLVAPAPPREIALTFDDLPASQGVHDVNHLVTVNNRILAALEAERAPAVGFVNEGKLGTDKERDLRIAILRRWVDAGFALGNHTASHLDFHTTTLERFQQDVIDGDRVTPGLMRDAGMKARWFRHPFTHTGLNPEVRSALDRFLAAQGYRTAPFTVENADYIFSDVYRRAKLRDDSTLSRQIVRAYLAHIDPMLEFFEALSREAFDREIRQVLLIHANDINADVLPGLLKRIRARGYTFITLERALEDEAYGTPDEYVAQGGPSWLHRWRIAKRMQSRLGDEPNPPDWLLKLYRP
jgi:peptidoglycan/xylan/chitin deacetylase (PgdA/CDA1 family)